MEETGRREKLDLVWAAVFLTAVIAVFLVVLFAFVAGQELVPEMAIVLLIGGALSVLNATLLLSVPGQGSALLTIGRLLVWVSFLAVAIACVLGVVSMVG
ncbi:MAG: hypothetical protein ACYSX0_16185 [Planctomycetota bacterium]|jgi:hypothetical protein